MERELQIEQIKLYGFDLEFKEVPLINFVTDDFMDCDPEFARRSQICIRQLSSRSFSAPYATMSSFHSRA